MQQGGMCTNCGMPIGYGQKFCGSCGAVQSSGCANCGNPLDPNARFCANCGAQSGGGAQQQPGWGQPQQQQPGWGQPQQQQPGWGQQQAWGPSSPSPQTGPSRGLLLALLFILLLALGGFIYWQFGSRLGNILSFLNITGPSTTAVNTTALEIEVSAVKASAAGTTAVITWKTNELASSQVEYGVSATYGSLEPAKPKNNPSTGESMGIIDHSIELTGLQAGSAYHYRAKSIDKAGNEAVSPDATFDVPVSPPPE